MPGCHPVSGAERAHRGSIDVLPSGAFRVRLYVGQDPPTKKRHTLTQTIPAGPGAEKQAEAALQTGCSARSLTGLARGRAPPSTRLLERYLDQFSGGENTWS